jgi:F-type H+-transporting ATPase subunit a
MKMTLPKSSTKTILLLASIGIGLLFVVGFLQGAIAKGTDNALLEKPAIHLQPIPVLESDAKFFKETHALPNRFVLTNTILSSWITTIILLFVFFLSTRKMSLVPRGLQNLVEGVISIMYDFVVSVTGTTNASRFLPFFATIFLFVALNAWLGLIPIYQSLGFINDGHMERHLLRPAGTDLNMPLALSIISFVFVEYWAIKVLGLRYFGKFFRFGGLIRARSLSSLFRAAIDIFVGLLELLSELVRIVSFTFRLFGNMTAGEILLLVTAFLVPFVFSLPFYGLEILVGFIQALIFASLTLVFVTMAIVPHEGDEH